MIETPETPETPQETLESVETTEEAPQDATVSQEPTDDSQTDPEPEDDAEDRKHSRSAAKYRTQLREAETRLEDQQGYIDGLHQQLVSSLLGSNFRDPADFHNAVAVSDLIDDAGKLDLELVEAKANDLLSERPHLARVHAAGRPKIASTPGRVNITGKTAAEQFGTTSSASWSDVLESHKRPTTSDIGQRVKARKHKVD